MLRISEIEWNDGQGLQDLSIHGIGPTKAMLEHLAGIIEGSIDNVDHGAEYALVYTVIQRLEDIERSLERFGRDALSAAA